MYLQSLIKSLERVEVGGVIEVVQGNSQNDITTQCRYGDCVPCGDELFGTICCHPIRDASTTTDDLIPQFDLVYERPTPGCQTYKQVGFGR